jgi:hypothetical protein
VSAADGLADRLVAWMAANRDGLDAMMTQEGSRAVHEEFLMAEGGTLPDMRARVERARGASARAWMRHLARGLEHEWEGAGPGLSGRVEGWTAGHGERLEALVLEERAVVERRGASGDPEADRRDAELLAHGRLLAEAVASHAPALAGEPPPAFSRRVAAGARGRAGRRREVEARAVDAWAAPADGREPDALRVREAAAVWAHVRVLAESLEQALEPAEGTT